MDVALQQNHFCEIFAKRCQRAGLDGAASSVLRQLYFSLIWSPF
jgi:hypothetical protein